MSPNARVLQELTLAGSAVIRADSLGVTVLGVVFRADRKPVMLITPPTRPLPKQQLVTRTADGGPRKEAVYQAEIEGVTVEWQTEPHLRSVN